MASVIRRFEISKLFKQVEFDARVFDYTNDDIVKVTGNVEITSEVNVLNIYFGKKSEYYKNKTIELTVDENGNFEELIQLIDGNGQYYITAELSTAGGSTDHETLKVIYETNSPLISELTVQNFDEKKRHNISEDYYIFYSEDKTYIDTYFTSVNNDTNNKYYYKLWLSYELEPENSIPLATDRSNVRVDISNVQNGEYFIFLKVIDSAGNVSVKSRRININKTIPVYDIDSLQIMNEKYYISLNDNITGNIKFLINSVGGSYIESGKIKLYKNNKLINYTDDTIEITTDVLINQYIGISGLYFLPEIDVKATWNLSEGDYEVEIFYTDIFGKQRTSNRVQIHVKNAAPLLESSDLDIENPASLIFSDTTLVPFSMVENFFSNEQKQIEMFRVDLDGNRTKVTTKNSDWIYSAANRRYETTLTIFFNNDDVNLIGDNYSYNIYEFKTTNDFGDETIFTTPIIYKPKKNTIVLSKDFLFPTSGIPTYDNGINASIDLNSIQNQLSHYLNVKDDVADDVDPKDLLVISSCNFLVHEIYDYLEIGIRILYDVDFLELSSFKTSGENLYYEIDGVEETQSIIDMEDIRILAKIKEYELDSGEVLLPVNNFVNVTLDENKSQSQVTDRYSFSFEIIEDKSYQIQKEFVGNQNQLSFFVEIDNNVSIESIDMVLDKNNSKYSILNYTSSVNFGTEEWKRTISSIAVISHDQRLFEPYVDHFEFTVFRDIRDYLKSFVHGRKIHDDTFDLEVTFPFSNGIENELQLFVDVEDRFNQQDLEDIVKLNEHEWSDTKYENGNLLLENIELPATRMNGSYYLNCYYKFKDSNHINVFTYFIEVNNDLLDLKFNFGSTGIVSTKSRSFLTINNTTVGDQQIQDLRIFSNNIEIFTLNFKEDFNILHIPINEYNMDGSKKTTSLYFETESLDSIIIEADYHYESDLVHIRTFISDIYTLSVIEEETFSNVSMVEIPQVYNTETLRNQSFEFIANTTIDPSFNLTLEMYKVIEFVNGVETEVVNPTIYTSTINFKTYYNKFDLSDFNVPDFEDGYYSIIIKVLDEVTNIEDVFSFELECYASHYEVDITSINFLNDNVFLETPTHELNYNITGGFTDVKFTNIIITLLNTDTGKVRSIIGPTDSIGNIVLLEFEEGHTEVTITTENRFGTSKFEYKYNFFYYSDSGNIEILSTTDNELKFTDSENSSYSKLGNVEYISTIENEPKSNFIFKVEKESEDINVYIINNNDETTKVDIESFKKDDHYSYDLNLTDLETFGFLIEDLSGNTRQVREFVMRDLTEVETITDNLTLTNNMKFDVTNYDYIDIFMDNVINAPIEFINLLCPIVLKK